MENASEFPARVKPSGRRSELTLTPEERAGLEKMARCHDRTASDRARAVLVLAGGATSARVADSLGLHPAAVRRIKARFLAGRVAGLGAQPRSGRPPEKRRAVQKWATANATRGRLEAAEGGVLSARAIARLVSSETGICVSVTAVRKALKKGATVIEESDTR